MKKIVFKFLEYMNKNYFYSRTTQNMIDILLFSLMIYNFYWNVIFLGHLFKIIYKVQGFEENWSY